MLIMCKHTKIHSLSVFKYVNQVKISADYFSVCVCVCICGEFLPASLPVCLSPRQVHSWGLMAGGGEDLPLNAFKVISGCLPPPRAPCPAPCPRH